MSNSGVPLNPQLLAQLQQMQQGGAAPMQDASSAPPPAAAQSVQPDMNQAGDAGGMAGGQPTTQTPAGGQQPQVDPRALIAQNIQRVQSLNPEADTARQQASTMQQPNFGPHITPGAGFLHNLGQVLQLAAEATKPGSAIIQAAYHPQQAQYASRQQQLGKQIADVQGQQELAQRGAESGATLAYHEDVIGERNKYHTTETGIQQQRADTAEERVNNQLQVAKQNIDIRGMLAGSQVALNGARTQLAKVMPSILEQRNDLVARGQDMTSANSQARDNVLAQLGVDKTHPIAQMLDNMLGTTMEPGAPQTPGGAQPVRGPNPVPPRSNAKQGAAGKVVPRGTVVYDPQGKPHSSDGTHPLPKGWSTQKAN